MTFTNESDLHLDGVLVALTEITRWKQLRTNGIVFGSAGLVEIGDRQNYIGRFLGSCSAADYDLVNPEYRATFR